MATVTALYVNYTGSNAPFNIAATTDGTVAGVVIPPSTINGTAVPAWQTQTTATIGGGGGSSNGVGYAISR